MPQYIMTRDITSVADPFTCGYLTACAWADCNNDQEEGMEEAEFSSEFLERAIADCKRFQEENAVLLEKTGASAHRNGVDFWLTRQGHGAGFWDRGYGLVGDTLTQAAKAFPNIDCYLGDDGFIYGDQS